MNNVTIKLYMLGALMKHRVSSNVDGRLSRGGNFNVKGLKQLLKPKNLTSSISKTHVLCFRTTTAGHFMFLQTPAYQGIVNVDAISSNRNASVRTCSLVCIRKCVQAQLIGSRVEKILTRINLVRVFLCTCDSC